MTLGILAASAVCATAGAPELYSFQAPTSWHEFTETDLSDRAVAIWRGPTDARFGENILLIVKPSSATLEQATNEGDVRSAMPGAQVSEKKMTVCGGHPAMYAYIVAPWHGSTLISENVISVWHGKIYSATYSRLSYQQTVEEARSALTTFCPSYSSSTGW